MIVNPNPTGKIQLTATVVISIYYGKIRVTIHPFYLFY